MIGTERHRRTTETRSERAAYLRLVRALTFIPLLPFLLLSMLSVGTMLGHDATGRLTVVLCDQAVPVALVVAPDGSLEKADDHPTSTTECPWAPHLQAVDLHGPAPDAVMALTLVTDIAPAAPARPRMESDRHVPAARGPPALI